jgi:hypothetical protein
MFGAFSLIESFSLEEIEMVKKMEMESKKMGREMEDGGGDEDS